MSSITSVRLSPVRKGFFWLLLLLPVFLVGCNFEFEDIKPEDLNDFELMVSKHVPISGELSLSQILGFHFVGADIPEPDSNGKILDPAPATITPAIKGHWNWISSKHISFYPDESYEPNTTYEVKLQPSFFSNAGVKLRGTRNFEFTAKPFKVERLYLDQKRVGRYPRTHMIRGTVSFNYPVDPEKFAEAMNIHLRDGSSVDFIVETTFANRHIIFRTVELEANNRDVRLTATLDGGLIPVSNGATLGENYARSITIPAIERLKIRSVDVTSREEFTAVVFEFSDKVLPEELKSHLKIDPPVDGLRMVGKWRKIELIGQWKFGTTYNLSISSDLADESGLILERDFSRKLTMSDLDPLVRITGPGNFLSLKGDCKVGIESINMDKFEVSVDRIHANNLVPFLQKYRLTSTSNYNYGYNLDDYGSPLYATMLDVAPGPRNKIQVTAVDLGDALSEESRGVFRLTVRKPNNYYGDRRWIVATDLGLVAKQSDGKIDVAVASISNLAPVSRVKVQVMSRNNQVLATSYTDAEGMVSFGDLNWDNGGGRPFVVVATKGQDLSFLAFDETRIRTADFDVGGVDNSEKGYRAYVYGDRDIYRPGEKAHLVWVVRDSHQQPPAGFPLNLKILAPGGQDFVNARVSCDEAGTGEYTVDLPNWAMTGKYTALLYLGEDNLLGEASFSVEDFIPDRMKVVAELLVGNARPRVVCPKDSVVLSAEAMTLFGPPAADRQANASIWYRKSRVKFPGYEEFTFGENLIDELPPRRSLDMVKTDDEGQVSWDIPLPKVSDYQGWLKLTTLVEVTELGGGRAVSTTAETLFSPNNHLIGLRNLSRDESDFIEPGKPIRFEGVMVDLDGEPVAVDDATLKVMCKQWRTVLKKDSSGRFRYISEYDEKLVEERKVSLHGSPTELVVTPNTYGSYRLVLENADGSVRGAIEFYVYGYGYSPWAMSNPEKINLKLDRETYGDGDVVTASVEAPFSGLMLVTIEREKVYSRRWVKLEDNTGTIQVKLPQGSAPNVYLTATLLRSLDELDPRSPARAFGAVPVFIDREPVTLPVEVTVPEKMRPHQKMTIKVRLPEDRYPMRVTVAAVDEGILQLTNYKTPSALDYFMQRRRLSVDSFDIWSMLLPEYERVLRKSSTGGDGGLAAVDAAVMAKRLNPLAADRVNPVALWSGLLHGKSGWQDISFDVPEFNGTLRVMVLAVAGDRFGSAETSVKVADPVVLSPSLPRFLAPGDKFRVPVPVYNGLEGDMDQLRDIQLGLKVDGPLNIAPGTQDSLTLPVGIGREEVAWFELQAGEGVGVAHVKFSAAAGGETFSRETELSVRPPYALAGKIHSGSVNQTQPFSQIISDQWYEGTAVTTVTVAANPVAQFGAALPYLLRYPYGCVEQITSRSFPLVYFGDLATQLAPGEFGEGDADYFINSGLDYVASMFRPGRGFAMWPGRDYGTPNAWATTYVTHFLVEAHSQGYVLPEGLLDGALSVVKGYSRSTDKGWPSNWTRRHRLRTRAYACYVLALADRPERGAMDQMAHSELKKLSHSSRTHLAGAYALIGNHDRFVQLLSATDAPVEQGRSTGFSWYSMARDEAMRLDVLATVEPSHPQVSRLLQRLANRAENGRWYNTQENAFALLAMGKLSRNGTLDPASGEVLVDGEVVATFDTDGVSIQSSEWAGKNLEIRTTSDGSAWFTVLDEGVPHQPEYEQYDSGIVVRREYFDTEGKKVDLMDLVQGQTIVCRLLLKSEKGRIEDIVLTDLVPAGLEIENPRLSRDGGYDWVGKAQKRFGNLTRDHLEIRDDRLLLFTSATTKVSAFYYSLRAVTAGSFVLPQVRAEAMYDPEVMSMRGGGEIRIVSP